MRLLASTRPQSRYASSVPERHRKLIGDSPWAMVGTVSRMLDPQEAYDYTAWHGRARDKWEKAADVAVEMGFDTLVIDAEIFRNCLDVALRDFRAATNATDHVAILCDWVRQRQPKLKQALYHCCPTLPAMNLTEDTAPETLAAYDALLAYEAKTLKPDVLVLESYYTGPGWLAELNRQAAVSDRFYPNVPRRVLINPDDYSKPGNPFVGEKLWRQMIREAAKVGQVEMWTDYDAMPWVEQAFDIAATFAGKN